MIRVFRRALALKYQAIRATGQIFVRIKNEHQENIDTGKLSADTPALTVMALREQCAALATTDSGPPRCKTFHGSKYAPGFFDQESDTVYLMFLEAKRRQEVNNLANSRSPSPSER